MLRTFLRSKIHRARVTESDLDYEGSILIDKDLLDAANIAPFEKVEIYDVTNGNRLETYTIADKAGSGRICINGAAARLVDPDDIVIICCYGQLSEDAISGHKAIVIHVDNDNKITETLIKTQSNLAAPRQSAV